MTTQTRSEHARGLAASVAILLAACACAVACQSAVNLDVTYDVKAIEPDGGDAAAPGPPATVAVDGGADADPTPPPPPGEELEGCPCDETQGLSCCVSAVGPSFCTTDRARCEKENGAFYQCFGPSVVFESVCCWHGTGALAVTSYAAECKDGGVPACTTTADCPSGLQCVTAQCGTIKIGACGLAPQCPPGTATTP